MVTSSVPQSIPVVIHSPEEETELLDAGGGQLAWVTWESPLLQKGETGSQAAWRWLGARGRMGLAACPIPVGLGRHSCLLLSPEALMGSVFGCASGCGYVFSLLFCVCLLHC